MSAYFPGTRHWRDIGIIGPIDYGSDSPLDLYSNQLTQSLQDMNYIPTLGSDPRGQVFNPDEFQRELQSLYNKGSLPPATKPAEEVTSAIKENQLSKIANILSNGGIPSMTDFYKELPSLLDDPMGVLAGLNDYNLAAQMQSVNTAYDRQQALMDKSKDINSALAADQRAWTENFASTQNQFTHNENQAAMNWSKEMRDTSVSSYYNQLAELGVNPLLAFNSSAPSAPNGASGSGMSASGSSASVGTPSSPYSSVNASNLFDVVLNGMNSAVSIGNTLISSLIGLGKSALSKGLNIQQINNNKTYRK